MGRPVTRRAALRSTAVAAASLATAACSLADDDRSRRPRSATGSTSPETPGATAPPPMHEVVLHDKQLVTVIDLPASASTTALTTSQTGELTAAMSQALFARATAVVVTSSGTEAVTAASAAATHLGIPLLITGASLADELDRLDVRTVVSYAGSDVLPAEDRQVIEGGSVDDLPSLPGLPRRPAAGAALVLRHAAPPDAAVWLKAQLAVAGADTVVLDDPDPRRSAAARRALRRVQSGPVVGLGSGFDPPDRFKQRIRTTRMAAELPGGGVLPFPGRRMVALYGHPETKSLGMLGEQSPSASVARVEKVARTYAGLLPDRPVVPAFELIATVASGSSQGGTYSYKTSIAKLMPWVEAAEQAGIYVVLDLQPGRTDFLTQAKLYEPLLRRPWVGLALDPEWRLQPHQMPLQQIGSVDVAEVNRVAVWLAGLVRAHDLPPKVLTLHEFDLRMIRRRQLLDTSLDEIQWLLHADGQGGQSAKQGTWSRLRKDLPDGVWMGWKNFEDEDKPMLAPAQTVASVHPTPFFVSYQ